MEGNLSYQPALPVVALCGLHEENDSDLIEKITKSGDHQIEFLFKNIDDEFPIDQTTTHDTRPQAGILESSWLPEHLRKIPQVVAFFVRLSWFDQNFTEKSLEIASRVSILKSSLEMSGSKICLVVIQPENSVQNSDPLNSSQKQAAEKLQDLAKACEISHLHVAEINYDKIDLHCKSVKDGLLKLVKNQCEDRIKWLRTRISNTSKVEAYGQKLLVRYYFQVGYYSETICEVENLPSNERATFKAYRTAYSERWKIEVI